MIDMRHVTLLMDKCLVMAEYLDGLTLTDVEGVKEKAEARSEKAEVSRQLLELADLVALTEQLVRNEYWIYKARGVDIEVGVWDD
jgi:hypothetical protein